MSFRAARYRSADLTLNTTELTDNVGQPLQSQTALDARLIASYDVPPYVNSVDQSGAVPFLDIGNQYILAGAQYDPQVLAGLSAAQIASQLAAPVQPRGAGDRRRGQGNRRGHRPGPARRCGPELGP